MGGEITWDDIKHKFRKLPDTFEFQEFDDCRKPGCPVPKRYPKPDNRCICRGPIWIAIPAGGHAHIDCPVHGDVVIRGSSPTYLESTIWKYEGPGPKVSMVGLKSGRKNCSI